MRTVLIGIVIVLASLTPATAVALKDHMMQPYGAPGTRTTHCTGVAWQAGPGYDSGGGSVADCLEVVTQPFYIVPGACRSAGNDDANAQVCPLGRILG